MKSLTTKLKKVRDVLLSTCSNVYHYESNNPQGTYIVWMENGEGNSLSVDDEKNIQVITGTIDMFTKNEYDKLIDDLQESLDSNKISYRLESVQYEEDTEYIHYSWRFEVS